MPSKRNQPGPRSAVAVLKALDKLYPAHPLAVSPRQPFQVLVATVLSSRTKDPVTNAAMKRLWQHARSPRGILRIPTAELAQLLKPVGFYATKAKHLHQLSRQLLDVHSGRVPDTRAELMKLAGVGRKVANLVLNICFGKPAICVDTHVHRIANRLGWVETETVLETEQALEQLVPEKWHAPLNRVLVNHGQQVCTPQSPHCSGCPIANSCARRGVERSR